MKDLVQTVDGCLQTFLGVVAGAHEVNDWLSVLAEFDAISVFKHLFDNDRDWKRLPPFRALCPKAKLPTIFKVDKRCAAIGAEVAICETIVQASRDSGTVEILHTIQQDF